MIDRQKKNQFEANQILIQLNPDYKKCCLCNLYFHIKNTKTVYFSEFGIRGINITRCFICLCFMHPPLLRKNIKLLKETYPSHYIFKDYLPIQPKYEPNKT